MTDRKEYIERGALLKEAESRLVWNHQAAGVAVYEAIQEAPAADVVEVVRCRDCVHYRSLIPDGERWCEILKAESPIEDGFCCYGERKDGGNNEQTLHRH